MKSCVAIFFLLLSVFISVNAQRQPEVRVGGNVSDSFTNVGLPAFVTLLNKDSVAIDTATCEVYQGNSFYTFYIMIIRNIPKMYYLCN